MKRLIFIFAMLTGCFLSVAQAQIKVGVAPLYPLTQSSKRWAGMKQEVVRPMYLSAHQYRTPQQIPVAKSPLGPRDYYQQHFGFFCKQEWNWEKQIQVPVKLRLGTYQAAQRMEGK
jgi:hypothetical protein